MSLNQITFKVITPNDQLATARRTTDCKRIRALRRPMMRKDKRLRALMISAQLTEIALLRPTQFRMNV